MITANIAVTYNKSNKVQLKNNVGLHLKTLSMLVNRLVTTQHADLSSNSSAKYNFKP